MNAADWLAVFGSRSTRIAEHESIRRQRNRFADVFGREPIRERGGDGFGGLIAIAGVNRLAQLFGPGVVALLVAGLAAEQMVLVKQLDKCRANARHGPLLRDHVL